MPPDTAFPDSFSPASIGSAPYQVKMFAAPEGGVPATIAEWGDAIGGSAGGEPGDVAAEVASARYIAVVFNEIGRDSGCNKNPYRGRINEVTFAPS